MNTNIKHMISLILFRIKISKSMKLYIKVILKNFSYMVVYNFKIKINQNYIKKYLIKIKNLKFSEYYI